MMSEKQVRAYRDDLKTCLDRAKECPCLKCVAHLMHHGPYVLAQITAFDIVLEEADASREIEEAALKARRPQS